MQQDCTPTPFRFGSHARSRVGGDHIFESVIRLADMVAAWRKPGIVASRPSHSSFDRLAREGEQAVLGRPFNIKKKHRSPARGRRSESNQAAGASHRAIGRA